MADDFTTSSEEDAGQKLLRQATAQLAKDNKLQLGTWKHKEFPLVIFDLSHVNEALTQHKVKPVHGIIGADILLHGKAIIDYYNRCLYLK